MENPARLRFSLTHSAAPATAATSPRSQFPPTVALLFPSLLRKAGITATGPQDAPDSEERLWLLPSIGALNNTDVVSSSSGGHKYKASHTGLELRCPQSWLLSVALCFAFLVFQGRPAVPGFWALPALTPTSAVSFLPLTLPSCLPLTRSLVNTLGSPRLRRIMPLSQDTCFSQEKPICRSGSIS